MEFETRRKKRNLFFAAAVAAILSGFILGALTPSKGVAPIIGGVAAVILFLIGGQIGRRLAADFKAKVVAPLIKMRYSGLEYRPDNGFSESEFKAMKLFQGRIDSFHHEDEVSGTVDSVPLRFSEIRATRTEGSGKNKRTVTVFHGIVLKAEFNKNFSCNLVVVPDFAEAVFGKLVGNFLQNFNFSQEQLIKLEDPEFEKAFAVYGSDQQQARYILTPALMKRILKLRECLGKTIYLSFRNNVVYIAVSRTKDIFELPFWGKLDDFQLAGKIIADLDEMISIISDLNLETRIWSKK